MNPEWEARVGDKSGTQAGDKCKLIRPTAPTGRQVGDKHKLIRPKAPRGGDKLETSVKPMWPKEPRAGD